jgi:hypothetical protein
MRNPFIIPEGKPDAGYSYPIHWKATFKWWVRRKVDGYRRKWGYFQSDKRYAKALGISYYELKKRDCRYQHPTGRGW